VILVGVWIQVCLQCAILNVVEKLIKMLNNTLGKCLKNVVVYLNIKTYVQQSFLSTSMGKKFLQPSFRVTTLMRFML